MQVGEQRDIRFDEVSERYLNEQLFTSAIYTEAGMMESYQEWVQTHSLPAEYRCLNEYVDNKQHVVLSYVGII